MDMVFALLEASDLTGKVVDFGCGDGALCEKILTGGGSVCAIDLDLSMIESTQKRLQKCATHRPGAHYKVLNGSVECLEPIVETSIDTLLAINVLAYMDKDTEQQFYKHAQRILRPGGILIVSHSNELFDMYTFNKYTVGFYKRHFSTHASMDEVRSLLTHPDVPERRVYPVRENPLNYKYKLASYGFREERQEFSILHQLPPLLMKNFNPDDLRSRECPDTIDWPASEKWKLMFMCSIFGSRAIRD